MSICKIAIVIPAWNEEYTIPECLTSLLQQKEAGFLDIVVVANGCSDATAKVARNYIQKFKMNGLRLQVLEINVACKTTAINYGDAIVNGDIRIYLDADVILSENAVTAISETLDCNEARIVSPQLVYTIPKNWYSRCHAKLYQSLPPISDDVVGGCYAVNKHGRSRWNLYPNIIADDAFVHSLFRRHERILIKNAFFNTTFPDGNNLPAVLERWHRGNMELNSKGIKTEHPKLFFRRLKLFIAKPNLILFLPFYIYQSCQAKMIAKQNFTQKHSIPWIRFRKNIDS